MNLKSNILWGVELHFKNGDLAFIDNGSLLKIHLNDIKTDFLSYGYEPQFICIKRCSHVYMKIHKSIFKYYQKNGLCCEDGLSILEMINNSSIEKIKVIDGAGNSEDIIVPWDRGPATVFNPLQRNKFEVENLVVEIGGIKA